ncbi:DUF995 domain-containing protein [Pandoraea sp. PE-S2R-1]|uniref:DUF995 domain-containing protein n=1 Tax=Pandoraea sp. PE-S2R-1 TaxID=1986994 RepID=UPI000B3FA801|nr:DUF995 domain-containing protein [Pandoraea sp. PE-S2R-1]
MFSLITRFISIFRFSHLPRTTLTFSASGSLAALCLCALSPVAHADPMHLSDIKQANGQQLSVDDLRSLMPGAHITNLLNNGSTRKWVNETDGSLNATTDNKGGIGSTTRTVQTAHATGTWSVNDNGSYCVNLEWRSLTENWCRFMFKVGDKYYGVPSLANGAAMATEFSIEK